MTSRDFLTIDSLSRAEILAAFDLAARLRASPGRFASALAGRAAVMLFEKPSLRTRLSFEIGLQKLGAAVMYFEHDKQRIGERETIHDYAKNIERFADVLIARVYAHSTLEQLAAHARIPVINALSDLTHPCQALADYLTIHQLVAPALGSLAAVRLAWMGDGNNVCHSLMLGAARLGVALTVITPRGYEPRADMIERARAIARAEGHQAALEITNDLDAVRAHHVVYTDVWVSMGQDDQADQRRVALRPYAVTQRAMAAASQGLPAPAVFMHCLPAHRGEEVDAAVIDGPHSIVFDQAENRMWAQNALLLKLLAPETV